MAAFRMFEGLSKLEINRVFGLGVVRAFDEGELIFRKGEVGHEMYVILTGKIDVVDELGTNIGVIAELAPGELLGEIAVFGDSHTHSAHAIAQEPSQVLVLSEEILTELLEHEIPKKFLVLIIRMLCNRLRTTNSMYMRARYGDKLVPKRKAPA